MYESVLLLIPMRLEQTPLSNACAQTLDKAQTVQHHLQSCPILDTLWQRALASPLPLLRILMDDLKNVMSLIPGHLVEPQMARSDDTHRFLANDQSSCNTIM